MVVSVQNLDQNLMLVLYTAPWEHCPFSVSVFITNNTKSGISLNATFYLGTEEVDRIDADLLGWWLCERQLKSGGFNGRPEKLPDVCYSW